MKQTSPLMIGICVALACISLSAIGYIALENTSSGAVGPAKVAVVDLDAVAQQLGRIDVMNQKLRQQGAGYDEKLKEIQESFQSQVTAKENELKNLGPNVTDQQKKEFAGLVQAAQNNLNLAKRKALGAVQQQKAVLVQQFRQETIAVAKKIAKEQGYDMIVAKNPTVLLSFDPAMDITEAVIEAMPAAAPTAEAPSEEVASAPGQATQAGENAYR